MPADDDATPSLHVSDGHNGKLLVRCHAGCAQERVVSALRARGLWPTPERGPTRANDNDNRLSAERKEYDSAAARSHDLRAAAGYSGKQAPTEYLAGRGITLVPAPLMLLPAKESRRLNLSKPFPAMVAPIIGEKGLQGASITFLTRDSSAKLSTRDDKPRRFAGRTRGGFVQLGEIDPDRPLIVAEGIETALSASQITGVPAIAALSAGNMANVDPPACSEVIIAADNDEPGREAARALAQRLLGQGRRVRIAIPEGPKGFDWNDALRAGTASKRALLAAEPIEPTRERKLTTRPVSQFEYREIAWLWWPFVPLNADRAL